MIELSDIESRAIQARLLERRFPQIKRILNNGEVLVAVAKRKPLYISGMFTILTGIFFIVQISAYFLVTNPQWSILALLFSILLTWAGVWLAILIRNENVLITDNRVVHLRVNFFGKLRNKPYSILLSEINSVHFYKKMSLFRSPGHMVGDILIKKKSKTYLIPTMYDSQELSEILMIEIKHHRNRTENVSAGCRQVAENQR